MFVRGACVTSNGSEGGLGKPRKNQYDSQRSQPIRLADERLQPSPHVLG